MTAMSDETSAQLRRSLERIDKGNYEYALKYDERALGVLYSWELAGAGGARFLLFKEPGVSPEDIRKAKNELRRTRDVVGLSVVNVKEEWQEQEVIS